MSLAAAAIPAPAIAVGNPAATAERPMQDPYVPPDARKPSTAAPTQGAALRAQVEQKLKRGFDAADVDRTGAITRQQAETAGLGYVVRNFDAIDRNRTGVVRFDDVKRYLREQGANLD